jgi:hypothetical protein
MAIIGVEHSNKPITIEDIKAKKWKLILFFKGRYFPFRKAPI